MAPRWCVLVLLSCAVLGNWPGFEGNRGLRMLETFSFARAITGAVTFTFGFLVAAGFPRGSLCWVWMVMGVGWALVGGARALLDR